MFSMSLVEVFESCSLSAGSGSKNGPATVKSDGSGKFQITSFFIDSSGHSNFVVPVELKFSAKEDLDRMISSKAIRPSPSNVVEVEDKDTNDSPDETSSHASEGDKDHENEVASIGFEARCSESDTTKLISVEGVAVLSTSVKDLTLTFETEVTVRAAENNGAKSSLGAAGMSHTTATVEISPVFTLRKLSGTRGISSDFLDLKVLELGAIPDHMQQDSGAQMVETRLTPLVLRVTLTHAFSISVESVPGSTVGKTMVSLTIRHSNLHRDSVTISNIAFHPGHSRYDAFMKTKDRSFGSNYSVTNVTNAVRWAYAPNTELRLPLELNPYDAYSTVLVLSGGEEMHGRSFTSPISVTGVVGRQTAATPTSSRRVVVAADVRWSTAVVAVEPADAFRVDMKVAKSEVKLGEQILVSLRIFNLSLEPRNVMLFMAKEEKANLTEREEIVNSAVVSEVDGYTFGVWGISGEDDGTIRLNRDHSMLCVDGALVLGEILGQHSINTEVRFVPLAEGCLNLPAWKLYDKGLGKWYTCTHNLSIVTYA